MKKYSDSTLKGFTKDFLIKTIRCLENNLEDCEYRNENQFRILCQMDLERAKYRWHDLRKDPNDLPNFWEYVLIHTHINEVYVAFTDANYHSWVIRDDEFDYCDIGSSMVKAWREIEPFKEDEE